MKKNPELFFKILLYASLPFVIYYLIKFDYLQFKTLQLNYVYLGISIVFLWLGFVFSTVAWNYALKLHKEKTTLRLSLVSHGLSVFAKYLPGKIWVILGRASYVANKTKGKTSKLSYISLKEQLLYILLGLIISFLPTVFFLKEKFWLWLLLATIVGLILLLFIKPIHDFSERLLLLIFKKEVKIPELPFILSLKLSGVILFYWALWILAFYFLLLSLSPDVLFIQSIAFPLSVCYGVLALIMPGGIGVREGIMVAFLIAAGVNEQIAIAISVVSRLWFISGEVFLFSTALVFRRKI